MNPETPLYQLATSRYPTLRAQCPTDGRRKTFLRLADEFWSDPSQSLAAKAPNPRPGLPQDADPCDHLTEGPEPGILLRTDYSDEGAWQVFCARLQEGERELAEAAEEEQTAAGDARAAAPHGAHAQADGDVDMAGDDGEEEEEEEEDGEDGEPPRMFKVIDPGTAPDRALFAGISNLTALRLLNDLDIRPAPAPPQGTRRVSPPNRLVDQKGWQEVYTGKPLWIYDSRSNADQCVRVVSQEGAALYGTATGDSWRARVSHICEIQMNMCMGMKIDFGERDGWDYSERRRNLDEAALPVS